MQTKRTCFATSMSCFLVVLAIAGCFRIDSTGPDQAPPPDAFAPGTSLEGPIRCDSMQCPSGSLCTHWSAGIDAGVPGNSVACSIVPRSCRVYDCNDLQERCSPCISELCLSGGYGYGVSVIGRNLYCPGG